MTGCARPNMLFVHSLKKFFSNLVGQLPMWASNCPWPPRKRCSSVPHLQGWSDKCWANLFQLLINHTAAQPFSDFRLESLTPLLQEVHMDPTWLEFEVDLLLILYPVEIGAPGTPGVSHGTKIFGPKIFSNHHLMNLFYGFCGLVMLKMP